MLSFLNVALDYHVTIGYIIDMKQVVYSKGAMKTLAKMPRNTAKRIQSKVSAYASTPESQAKHIKVLQNSDGLLRLRVGDWRIILKDDQVLLVLKVGPRGSVYEDERNEQNDHYPTS